MKSSWSLLRWFIDFMDRWLNLSLQRVLVFHGMSVSQKLKQRDNLLQHWFIKGPDCLRLCPMYVQCIGTPKINRQIHSWPKYLNVFLKPGDLSETSIKVTGQLTYYFSIWLGRSFERINYIYLHHFLLYLLPELGAYHSYCRALAYALPVCHSKNSGLSFSLTR